MPIARTPEECDRWFAECVRLGRLDDLVDLYEPGAHLLGQNGAIARGRSEIRNVLTHLTDAPTTIDMDLVRVAENDGVAVLYNDWRSRAAAADGTAREARGKAVEVVRRQPDGRWLFAIDDPFGRG